MNILCLFAGQGEQSPELFKFFQKDEEATKLLNEYFGRHSINLPQQPLPITDPNYSQLLIGIYQLTLFHLIEPLLLTHRVDCAGYSLGEVSAFLASSNASIDQIMQVLSFRTQLMTSLLAEQPDNHFDLLFITGNLESGVVDTLCKKFNCFIAIINLEQHFVIGGNINHLLDLQRELSQFKTHSKFLNINLPSHTPLYEKKKGQFKSFLSTLNLNKLSYALFSPITLTKIYDSNEAQSLLDQELYTCIQWNKVCELIKEYRYDLIIDLGPGNSMTHFLNLENESGIITVAQYKNSCGLMKSLTALLS